jgi:Ras-related protein Rab-39B
LPIKSLTHKISFFKVKPGVRVKLQLWDTAGQEKFKSITKSYYRNTAGIIVVYDITNRKSFDHVGEWLSEAEANVSGPDPSQCVFQIIGHKADLEKDREVLYEEGEYFSKYHKVKFIETSAFTGDNVNEAFYMIAREINSRFESGALKLQDGWDGIKSGVIRAQSINLSQYSGDEQQNGSSCSC